MEKDLTKIIYNLFQKRGGNGFSVSSMPAKLWKHDGMIVFLSAFRHERKVYQLFVLHNVIS